MFLHFHPYAPFITNQTNTLIVGTLPPPRFCKKEFKENDVDFCYGSKDNLLWPVLNEIFKLDLLFNNTSKAIEQRINFLQTNKIGICDIVESCNREKIDASDLGMINVELRDLLGYIKHYSNIRKIIFTGKNSKNGPEYFFRKQIRAFNLKLEPVKNEKIRTHKLKLEKKEILTYSLTSPSNAANRSIGANKLFKEQKALNKSYSTIDFRIQEYKLAFFE